MTDGEAAVHANSEQSTRQEANQQHIHTYTNAHTPNKTTQPNRGPAETPPRRGPAPTREERPRRRDPTRRKGGREDPTGRRDTSPEPREPPPSATQTAQAGPVPDHPKLQPHGGDATSAEDHPEEAQAPTPTEQVQIASIVSRQGQTESSCPHKIDFSLFQPHVRVC